MEKTLATILCIDDEENQLVLRKLMLERAGYRVLTAESPAEAIALFGSDTVDLVIVDYYMPGMNGLALAREILRQKKLPIVVLSAYAELPADRAQRLDTSKLSQRRAFLCIFDSHLTRLPTKGDYYCPVLVQGDVCLDWLSQLRG